MKTIQIERGDFGKLEASPDGQHSNDNLVCGNCGFQSEDLDSYAYHAELCVISVEIVGTVKIN